MGIEGRQGLGEYKFVGNELSISNVVMKGSIYVMTRHNEPSGLCTQQSGDSGHMMVGTI